MNRQLHICGTVILTGLVSTGTALAGQAAAGNFSDVTYTKDIAPILQRSCQTCHRPDSVAPMSLLTYQQARPWARAMKMRTGIGPRAGVMPPWYLERDIGIQHYKNDPSLTPEEIAKIAAWADNGAPEGNPADLPEPIDWNASAWSIGEPDLITVLPDITMKGTAPDWWGEIETTPVGITEDRYVAALEFKEVNDVDVSNQSRDTVPVYLSPHDLEHPGRGRRCRAGRPAGAGHDHRLAGARGRAKRGHLRPEGGPAAVGQLERRLEFPPLALERPRHHRAPGDRLEVPPGRLRA